MKRIASDSMPPAAEDFMLHYEGYHSIPSWGRVRVYRPEGQPPVIVATNPYDVEDSGTSVTNRAELVFRLAWSRIGELWPARFMTHYAAQEDAETGKPLGMGESFTFVSFPLNSDGRPLLREDLTAGTTFAVGEVRGDDPADRDINTREDLTLDVAFGEPTWHHPGRAEVEAAIGAALLSEPVRVDVAPATIENSPAMRYMVEHFWDNEDDEQDH
jgi:hypothetical protein